MYGLLSINIMQLPCLIPYMVRQLDTLVVTYLTLLSSILSGVKSPYCQALTYLFSQVRNCKITNGFCLIHTRGGSLVECNPSHKIPPRNVTQPYESNKHLVFAQENTPQ